MPRFIKMQVKCQGRHHWVTWTTYVESENLFLCKRCKAIARENPGFFKRPKKEKVNA